MQRSARHPVSLHKYSRHVDPRKTSVLGVHNGIATATMVPEARFCVEHYQLARLNEF